MWMAKVLNPTDPTPTDSQASSYHTPEIGGNEHVDVVAENGPDAVVDHPLARTNGKNEMAGCAQADPSTDADATSEKHDPQAKSRHVPSRQSRMLPSSTAGM
jgi:hypothetical protein